jgi:hypothetical protein
MHPLLFSLSASAHLLSLIIDACGVAGYNGCMMVRYFEHLKRFQATFKMSVSDNSTIAPSSDVDGSFQSLDERSKERQPGNELSVASKGRRLRRPPRSTAMAYGADSLDGSESFNEGPNEGTEGGETQVPTERS